MWLNYSQESNVYTFHKTSKENKQWNSSVPACLHCHGTIRFAKMVSSYDLELNFLHWNWFGFLFLCCFLSGSINDMMRFLYWSLQSIALNRETEPKEMRRRCMRWKIPLKALQQQTLTNTNWSLQKLKERNVMEISIHPNRKSSTLKCMQTNCEGRHN